MYCSYGDFVCQVIDKFGLANNPVILPEIINASGRTRTPMTRPLLRRATWCLACGMVGGEPQMTITPDDLRSIPAKVPQSPDAPSNPEPCLALTAHVDLNQ